MEFSDIIQQFAERFGIGAPEIVDDAAAFDADGIPLFLMRVAKEGEIEYLVVAADLGEPPPQRLEKLYQAMLDASHNFAGAGGGVLARNPSDGHIWLQSREAFASIDSETAISKVKALGDAAAKRPRSHSHRATTSRWARMYTTARLSWTTMADKRSARPSIPTRSRSPVSKAAIRKSPLSALGSTSWQRTCREGERPREPPQVRIGSIPPRWRRISSGKADFRCLLKRVLVKPTLDFH